MDSDLRNHKMLPPSLIYKIGRFESALASKNYNKEQRKTHHELEKYIEHCTWEHLDWYQQSSPAQKALLSYFLMELDRQKHADPSDNRAKDIHKGITEIMNALTMKIEQLDHRFKGTLFGVGSFHNQTKIEEPDEFDFVYELDACTLLNKESANTFYYRNHLHVETQGLSKENNLFDSSELKEVNEPSSDSRFSSIPTMELPVWLYKDIVRKEGSHWALNYEHIAFAFFQILNQALQEVDLPNNWTHGGFDRPQYSGVRFNFPSFLIQLYYEGTEDHKPLSISLDFVPVLKTENRSGEDSSCWSDKPNNRLEDKVDSEDRSCWVRMTMYDEPLSTRAEEQFLANYPPESIPKTVIRICKELHKLAHLSTSAYLTKSGAEEVARYLRSDSRKEPVDQSLMWTLESRLRHADEEKLPKKEFATGDDISETFNSFDYLSSYIFKLAVMTLVGLDPGKGKTWTLEDTGDLVLSVYMVINDMLVSDRDSFLRFCEKCNNPIPETECIGEISVPLECYYNSQSVTGTQKAACTSQLLPKLYLEFRQAIQGGKCNKMLSLLLRGRKWFVQRSISAFDNSLCRVFEMLQNVLERKSCASLTVWGQKDKQEDIRRKLITKEELAQLLKAQST